MVIRQWICCQLSIVADKVIIIDLPVITMTSLLCPAMLNSILWWLDDKYFISSCLSSGREWLSLVSWAARTGWMGVWEWINQVSLIPMGKIATVVEHFGFEWYLGVNYVRELRFHCILVWRSYISGAVQTKNVLPFLSCSLPVVYWSHDVLYDFSPVHRSW